MHASLVRRGPASRTTIFQEKYVYYSTLQKTNLDDIVQFLQNERNIETNDHTHQHDHLVESQDMQAVISCCIYVCTWSLQLTCIKTEFHTV